MSLDAKALRKLASLDLTSEQMAGVLDVLASMTEQDEARKASQRERTRKFREKIGVTLQSQHGNGDRSRVGVTRVEDKTSNSKIEPQKENKKREHALAEFSDWYAGYPHKVQRAAAERAFVKARATVSLETLKAGVQRYIASKPPERHWQNPATWLNGEGWLDQPANVVPMARGSPLSMADFLGDVIETREQRNAGPDSEIEGYPPHVRSISRSGWPG